MSQLQIIKQNGRLLVDSREIAEMVERPHNDLMKTIRGYIEHLGQGDFSHTDFFIDSSYSSGQNKVLPRFLLTRKGCDMVANKMTGEKGVLFTAAYVTKFEEMEQTLKPSSIEDLIIMQAQSMKDLRLQMTALEQKADQSERTIETIQETFMQRDEDWRNMINGMMRAASYRRGGDYQELRNESYKRLEERGKCNLNIRLTNLKERLHDSGATKTKVNQTSRMDVIESEPRLKEIYTVIVKELAIGTLQLAK